MNFFSGCIVRTEWPVIKYAAEINADFVPWRLDFNLLESIIIKFHFIFRSAAG